MTAENFVPFKVFLMQNDVEPEIRRFSVSKDAVTSFIYLKQKLTIVFPSLKEIPFTVSWKDREGDLVQIWSDEELIIALTEMEDDNKKLYVTPSQNLFHNQPGSQFDDELHFGVSCDGCDKEVKGFRYKCAICPDFDLCQDCEAKKVHRMHLMVRIPNPVLRDVDFGKKIMRQFHRFNRHSMKPDRECRKGFDYHKRGGGGHCPFVPQQQCTSNNRAQGAQSSSQSRPFFEQGLPINVEGIIESVMQGLMRMAGGEVADPPTKEKSSTEDPPAPQTTPAAQDPHQVQNGVHFATPPSTSSSVQEIINIPSNSENNHQEVRYPLPEVMQISSPSVNKPSTSEMEHETCENSWTILNKVSDNENRSFASNTPQNGDIMKGAGDMQPPPYQQHGNASSTAQSSNPNQAKIEDSLNRMLSMGFNNEGDFLRQVLIAKKGDIEQVLDMLLPARRNPQN